MANNKAYIERELIALGLDRTSDAFQYIKLEAEAAAEILSKREVLDLIADLVHGPLALPTMMFLGDSDYESED
jgi:hypothetical protein